MNPTANSEDKLLLFHCTWILAPSLWILPEHCPSKKFNSMLSSLVMTVTIRITILNFLTLASVTDGLMGVVKMMVMMILLIMRANLPVYLSPWAAPLWWKLFRRNSHSWHLLITCRIISTITIIIIVTTLITIAITTINVNIITLYLQFRCSRSQPNHCRRTCCWRSLALCGIKFIFLIWHIKINFCYLAKAILVGFTRRKWSF